MAVDGAMNKTAEKLKRARAGEFMMPQNVELAMPVAFRCSHCGKSENVKRVMLQCWPDRRGEKAGLIVVCPVCGCRKQVSFMTSGKKKGTTHSNSVGKVFVAVAALLGLTVLTIAVLVKLDLLQLPERSGGTGRSGGQEYTDDTGYKDDTDDTNDTGYTDDTNDTDDTGYTDEPVQEEVQKQSHYEVMKADVTWDEAEERCEGRVYNGVNGHLAVITSQEEYDTVVSVLNEYISAHPGAEKLYYIWIGGWIDDEDAKNYIFNYRWVTGEEWSFENWCSTYSDKGDYIGEPSYYDGDLIENRLILWGYQRDKIGWTFSDQNGDLPLVYPPSKGEIGYICEFDESE